MYTHINFKTKKALKEAVAAHQAGTGKAVTYYQAGPFGGKEQQDGTFCVEGPHFPEPHRWYASCTAKDGVIIKAT